MIPLYRYSAETAKHDVELDTWRESKKENIRCRDFLDEQIGEKFDGMHLPNECVENTVKEFGYDRTMWVIANTIQERKGDGRFHSRNTEWAKRFNIPDAHRKYEFALNSHSCLVDGAADDIRKMYAELNLFSGEHIVRSDEPQDYTNKLLILRDTSLKEEYRTPENQLFFATGGFGCSLPRAVERCSDSFCRTVKKRNSAAKTSSAQLQMSLFPIGRGRSSNSLIRSMSNRRIIRPK